MADTILLVDDEEGIRKVLSISLEDCGYRVSTAQNGEEALRIFRQVQPQIVLTDIKMPGMDGIELLQRIKEESPDTEVIMITGYATVEVAREALGKGAFDFIAKPFKPNDLREVIVKAAAALGFKGLTTFEASK